MFDSVKFGTPTIEDSEIMCLSDACLDMTERSVEEATRQAQHTRFVRRCAPNSNHRTTVKLFVGIAENDSRFAMSPIAVY